MSVVFFTFGWFGLLKTNNPLTRYNPFSLNPKFKSKMEHSMNEDPGQIFRLDIPDDGEVKKFERDKKIDKILNSRK